MAPPPGKGYGAIRALPNPADDPHYLRWEHFTIGDPRPNFPPNFSLFTNRTLDQAGPYLKYIFDQGRPGSCVCNAVAAAYMYEMQHQRLTDYYGQNPCTFIPSRLHMYYLARLPDDCKDDEDRRMGNFSIAWMLGSGARPPMGGLDRDTGSLYRKVLRLTQAFGVVSEGPFWHFDGGWGAWPYQDAEVRDVPGSSDGQFASDSLVATIPTYELILNSRMKLFNLKFQPVPVDTQLWKGAISVGYPIMFSMMTYEHMDWSQRIISLPRIGVKIDGGHGVLAVGWDDNIGGGCFLVQNSWGGNWGEEGCFYLPYTWLTAKSPPLINSTAKPIPMIADAWSLWGSRPRANYKDYIPPIDPRNPGAIFE